MSEQPSQKQDPSTDDKPSSQPDRSIIWPFIIICIVLVGAGIAVASFYEPPPGQHPFNEVPLR